MKVSKSRHRFSMLAGLFVSTFGVSAHAQTYRLNVSEYVVGVHQSLNWLDYDVTGKDACSSACRFALASTAGIEMETKRPSLAPHVWPPALGPNGGAPPHVLENAPTPQGVVVDGHTQLYPVDDFRRAQVAFLAKERTVLAQTFASGSVATATSLHIEVDGSQTASEAVFLEFGVPGQAIWDDFAYTLIPGSNGGTYVYKAQESGDARTAVDVNVDGLSVWSSSRTQHYIEAMTSSMFQSFDSAWGHGQAQGDRMVLFLGYLPEGESWSIDVALRADAHAVAPKCGTSSGTSAGLSPDEKMHHCYTLGASVEPTAQRSLSSDVHVFTKAIP